MRTIKLTSLLALVIVITGLQCKAQTKQNFTGRWVINLEKSTNGESAPKQMEISQAKDSLAIKRVTTDDKSFVEKLTFNGATAFSITTSGRQKSGTVSWDNSDQQSFTETAMLSEPSKPGSTAFKVTEKWSVSADGREISVETTLSNLSGQSTTMEYVYVKQQ